MRRILIITSSFDKTVDYIINKFSNINFIRLNVDELEKNQISITNFPEFRVSIKNETFKIANLFESIFSIYYRKLFLPDLNKYDANYHTYMQKEIYSFITGLVDSFNGKILTTPSILRKVENKIYQLKIANDLNCNIAYFSLDENSATALKLAKEGKIVAVYENGFITIKKGEWKIRVEKATHVPLTLGGKAKFMIANVLAATLAAYLQGFKTEDISLSLQTFIPSAAQTPGRMNIFDFNKFKVLIDFAHNPSGYRGIEEYLESVSATKKIGIIAGVGDRRDEDIKECAKIAGRMFDHIIIRQEKHLRGRTEEEINSLILAGIAESGRNVTTEIITAEVEALKHAMDNAEDGSFITALSDVIDNAIETVQDYLDKENEESKA